MTIGDLIERLRSLDPNWEVYLYDSEWGETRVTHLHLSRDGLRWSSSGDQYGIEDANSVVLADW